jgi:hypothetical protein
VITFEGWPKTPRLFRDMVVTEKIDGTNAAVIVEATDPHKEAKGVEVDGAVYAVGAQSRKRLITPQDDNFGFAAWVWEHAADLARILGPGRHFGEWWGSGIQRGYGLANGDKRFSLFNVHRYDKAFSAYYEANGQVWPDLYASGRLGVVPTLYAGPFNLGVVEGLMAGLMNHGSKAAPGFARPEGVIVYHTAAGQVFKALLENDDKPKGEAA